MMHEWLMELAENTENRKEMKDVVDKELKYWLQLLLNLVDITGDNPAQHLKPFIRGKERIIKEYKQYAQEHVRILYQRVH